MGFNGSFGVGFGLMHTLFPIIFLFIFGVILTIILCAAVKGLKQYKRNNDSPVLTVECVVVAKRNEMRRHHHTNDMMHSVSTRYYATFQVESGDRMELPLSGEEYGLLAEGDRGKLTFQGTRYLGFVRHPVDLPH